MRDIQSVRDELGKHPFPNRINNSENWGNSPAEVNSTILDCTNRYLNGDSLDQSDKLALKGCASELRKQNPKLVGDAQLYFGLLYRLCDLLLSRKS